MNNLILYGIGDAKYQYRVLKYFCVYDEHIDIAEIKRIARMMQVVNPSIEHVYLISNRHGLKREFQESNGTRLRAAQFSKTHWKEKEFKSSNLS